MAPVTPRASFWCYVPRVDAVVEAMPMLGLSGAFAFAAAPRSGEQRTTASELAAGAWALLEEYVGSRLFACDSMPEFEDAFEALLEDLEYHRQQSALMEFVSAVKLAMLSPDPPAHYRRGAGERNLDQLQRIGHLMAATAKAFLQAISRMRPKPGSDPGSSLAEARAATAADPLFYIADENCPPAVRAALAAGDRAALATVAVAAAASRRVRDDQQSFLLDEWENGQREVLRLLAGMPGVSLPAQMKPEEVLPLNDLMHETALANAAFERQLQAARQTGAAIYPPIQHRIDD